ncbi:MAG: chemotaxis protein CheW [Methanobacteriota archaeon]
MKILVFSLDNHRYAMPLSTAERVIRMVEITPLPKAPDSVLGIINMHGKIIPVYNIRQRFDLPEREIEIHDQLIIAHTTSQKVAMAVETVEGIIELSDQSVPIAEFLPSIPYVNHVVKLPDGMILVIDIDGFLSLPEEEFLLAAISQGSEYHE